MAVIILHRNMPGFHSSLPAPIKSYFMSFSHSEHLTSVIINAVNHNSCYMFVGIKRIYAHADTASAQYVRRSSIYDE